MLPSFRHLALLTYSVCAVGASGQIRLEDGVDVTYPIHHQLDDKSSIFSVRYEATMAGCHEKFSKHECDFTERTRLQMNLDQPSSQHNYTSIGFKKTRVPHDIWEDIQNFYAKNREEEHPEILPRGNTYVNSWDSVTQMVNIDDPNLGGGLEFRQRIFDSVKTVLTEWTGHELTETSLYGVRVYKAGAILATHVDRLPLVTSAIIQVAQDTDEPWPLEVVSHDGRRHNVTMDPGDMVLYESHTVLHGRPYPLVGKNYANIFVHFVPDDHDMMNEVLQKTRASLTPLARSNVTVEESVTDELDGFDAAEYSLQSTPNESGTCRNMGEVDADEMTTPGRVCLIEEGHGNDRSIDTREFFLGDAQHSIG